MPSYRHSWETLIGARYKDWPMLELAVMSIL